MRKYCAGLFSLGIMLSAFATANADDLKVTVPFDFVVSGEKLPAATYTVRETLPNSQAVVAFQGRDTIFALATDVDTSVTGTKLVFHRINDQYFLSDIVSLNGNWHFAVSQAEAELARRVNEQPREVAVGY